MLEQVALKNFKCFDALAVACAPLTLLCGLNGMGKSSVIQSLLVLRQSFESGALTRGSLMLDGSMADLGTGMDVLFQGAEEDVISFELRGSDVSPCRLSFAYSRTSDNLKSSGSVELPELWRTMPPFGGGLFYVSADRTGPQKSYPQSESFAQRGDLGARGEYTLNYLHSHENESLAENDPRCKNHPTRLLSNVVEHWLQEISPRRASRIGIRQKRRRPRLWILFRPKRRCSHTSVPGDERGLRPLVYPSRADFNAGATRDSVPHREPRGAPTSARADPDGGVGRSRCNSWCPSHR